MAVVSGCDFVNTRDARSHNICNRTIQFFYEYECSNQSHYSAIYESNIRYSSSEYILTFLVLCLLLLYIFAGYGI